MSDTVTLTRAEYQDLVDARDHAIAMRDVASGALPTIPDAAMDDYLAAPTPLAFWRGHRGLTQAALAGQVGISMLDLDQIECGHRRGDVMVYSKLARALQVRIEDLVPVEEGSLKPEST